MAKSLSMDLMGRLTTFDLPCAIYGELLLLLLLTHGSHWYSTRTARTALHDKHLNARHAKACHCCSMLLSATCCCQNPKPLPKPQTILMWRTRYANIARASASSDMWLTTEPGASEHALHLHPLPDCLYGFCWLLVLHSMIRLSQNSGPRPAARATDLMSTVLALGPSLLAVGAANSCRLLMLGHCLGLQSRSRTHRCMAEQVHCRVQSLYCHRCCICQTAASTLPKGCSPCKPHSRQWTLSCHPTQVRTALHMLMTSLVSQNEASAQDGGHLAALSGSTQTSMHTAPGQYGSKLNCTRQVYHDIQHAAQVCQIIRGLQQALCHALPLVRRQCEDLAHSQPGLVRVCPESV